MNYRFHLEEEGPYPFWLKVLCSDRCLQFPTVLLEMFQSSALFYVIFCFEEDHLGIDYIRFKTPLRMVCIGSQRALHAVLQPWFAALAADPLCSRCHQAVVGCLFLQAVGLKHYGCIARGGVLYTQHPASAARALRGSSLGREEAMACGNPYDVLY